MSKLECLWNLDKVLTKFVLTCSILQALLKKMECGLPAYPSLSPVLCFSWIIFLCFYIYVFLPSPFFGVLGYGDHDGMSIS